MGDQLQTTERPSCVLDYISTDDSVITFAETYDLSANISADVGVTLLLEDILLRRPAFLSSARFTLSSPPVKNVWHREISDASI